MKPLARAMGLPFFPITPFFPWLGPLALLPLPVQYHIRYGEPMRFHERYGPEAVRSPETVRMLADNAQAKVQEMVDRGLAERTSVFGLPGRLATPRLLRDAEREKALGPGATPARRLPRGGPDRPNGKDERMGVQTRAPRTRPRAARGREPGQTFAVTR